MHGYWLLNDRFSYATSVETNTKVAKLEQLVDTLQPFIHGEGALSDQFEWVDHESYENIRLTTSMNELMVEAAVFK